MCKVGIQYTPYIATMRGLSEEIGREFSPQICDCVMCVAYSVVCKNPNKNPTTDATARAIHRRQTAIRSECERSGLRSEAEGRCRHETCVAKMRWAVQLPYPTVMSTAAPS